MLAILFTSIEVVKLDGIREFGSYDPKSHYRKFSQRVDNRAPAKPSEEGPDHDKVSASWGFAIIWMGEALSV